MASDRPAARVICLDRDDRVLLLHWHDRVSGLEIWEPPGGGIDPGETPLSAARRELTEETGLPGSAVLDHRVEVDRDFTWEGVRYVKTESFFLARFDASRPAVIPAALTPGERQSYLGALWTHDLPSGLEPPHLATVIADLTRHA